MDTTTDTNDSAHPMTLHSSHSQAATSSLIVRHAGGFAILYSSFVRTLTATHYSRGPEVGLTRWLDVPSRTTSLEPAHSNSPSLSYSPRSRTSILCFLLIVCRFPLSHCYPSRSRITHYLLTSLKRQNRGDGGGLFDSSRANVYLFFVSAWKAKTTEEKYML
jgi:hypothetical protein